jgi:hypothetical protein
MELVQLIERRHSLHCCGTNNTDGRGTIRAALGVRKSEGIRGAKIISLFKIE